MTFNGKGPGGQSAGGICLCLEPDPPQRAPPPSPQLSLSLSMFLGNKLPEERGAPLWGREEQAGRMARGPLQNV